MSSFKTEKKDNYSTVSCGVEKLDSTVSPDLKAEIVFINGRVEKNMVIDLTGVKYIDSSGLSAILVANRLCKGTGGVLVITGISESVMKLITISQLDTVINIIQNPKEIEDFIIMESIENDLLGGDEDKKDE
jgi:anti-sigma B factor antagonist